MTKYTFTTEERGRIRAWLEKRPDAETLAKEWPFVRDNGDCILLSRVTQYIPGGKWKTRIAYCKDEGYPIMTSGALQNNLDMKVGKQVKPGAKKPVGKGKAKFEDAVIADIQKHLDTTNPIWDMAVGLGSVVDGVVTLKVPPQSASHKAHLDQHLAAYKHGKETGQL